jgi:hypothetical protein
MRTAGCLGGLSSLEQGVILNGRAAGTAIAARNDAVRGSGDLSPSAREPMRNFCIQPRRKQRQEKPPKQCCVVTRPRLLKAKREDQNHRTS